MERVTYDEVMLRYGSDRPDRRLGMEIHDLAERVPRLGVQGLRRRAGGRRRGARASSDRRRADPRSRFDELTEQAQSLGAKGLAWAVVEQDGGWRSPMAKFLKPEEMSAAAELLGAVEGDAILIVADSAEVAARVLGAPARGGGATPSRRATTCFWVVDFPMFEWNEDERRWDALHHPFTSPHGGPRRRSRAPG